jgi:hypothetical protein
MAFDGDTFIRSIKGSVYCFELSHLRFIALKSLVLCPDVGFLYNVILTLAHYQGGAFDGSVLDGPHIESSMLGITESIDMQSDVSSVCTPDIASANLMSLSRLSSIIQRSLDTSIINKQLLMPVLGCNAIALMNSKLNLPCRSSRGAWRRL